MVEDTESPRIFHVWSALFAVSAALGRRCYLPFGTGDIYPNMFTLLIGTPGTRKSTAASQAKRVLKSCTGVRFAPKDTGFQRQGLLDAFRGVENEHAKEFAQAAESLSKVDELASLMDLVRATTVAEETEEETKESFVDEADKHHLALVASEFSQVIGQNNMSMMDFLGERYDGEDYEYKTLRTHVKLPWTLMNMLACSTPVSIANALPPAAGGQGFLSRVILVYGAKKYKQVPRPKAPDVEDVSRVKDVLSNIYYELSGAFDETEDAAVYCESLYSYAPDISDSRFAYYGERRFTHLIKVAMCLCASRGSLTIESRDYAEAHRILRATERGMPDALGEFGLNPLAMLKQEILEQLRASQGPLAMEQVVAMFHRDARSHEITEVINDLIRSNQVKVNTLKSGSRVLSAVFSKQSTQDAMMNLLAET
jgi:hypothetical protein